MSARRKKALAKDQKYDSRLVFRKREFDRLREWAVKKLEKESEKGSVSRHVSDILGNFFLEEFADYKKELMNLDSKPAKTGRPMSEQVGRAAVFRLTDSKGKTLGFSLIRTTEEGRPSEQLIYIDPKHRGKKLSEKLARSNENLFFSRGHDRIILRVFNPILKENLRKRGYEIIERKNVKDPELLKVAPLQGYGFLAIKKKPDFAMKQK